MPLVIGSEFTLADGLKLVLYATDRATLRRPRAAHHARPAQRDKGQLRADPRRCRRRWRRAVSRCGFRRRRTDRRPTRCRPPMHAGSPTSSPAARGSPRNSSRAPATARGLRACRRSRATTGLPLVAAGDVHMHARARRALQDTLTAIRLRTPLAECGYALFPNGERHLRSRARLATLYPRELTDATLDLAAALHVLARRTALRISGGTGAAGHHAGGASAQAGRSGTAAAVRRGARSSPTSASSSSTSWR